MSCGMKMKYNSTPQLETNPDGSIETQELGKVPKVTVDIIDCEWPCSLDITLLTRGLREQTHVPYKSTVIFLQGKDSHILIYN